MILNIKNRSENNFYMIVYMLFKSRSGASKKIIWGWSCWLWIKKKRNNKLERKLKEIQKIVEYRFETLTKIKLN